MKVGLTLPQLGTHVTRQAVRGFCEEAERLGFASLWVQEHLFFALNPSAPYAARSRRRLPPASRVGPAAGDDRRALERSSDHRAERRLVEGRTRPDGRRLPHDTALKRGGRQRNLERRAIEIQTALRTEQLAAPAAVADAFAATTRASVGIIVELNRQISQLEATLTTSFEQHPDSDIYHSLPGFGVVLGARALGEFGDDPNRYANTKSRRNYAGTSPLTIASGKKKAVLARHVRNRRLYDALDQAAFCSLTQSPGCRLFYDQQRANGDLHHQALRALANRLVGILHGCLDHHTLYNEHTA